MLALHLALDAVEAPTARAGVERRGASLRHGRPGGPVVQRLPRPARAAGALRPRCNGSVDPSGPATSRPRPRSPMRFRCWWCRRQRSTQLNTRLKSRRRGAGRRSAFGPTSCSTACSRTRRTGSIASTFATARARSVQRWSNPARAARFPTSTLTGEQGHAVGDKLAAYRADARMNGEVTFGMNAIIVDGFEQACVSACRGARRFDSNDSSGAARDDPAQSCLAAPGIARPPQPLKKARHEPQVRHRGPAQRRQVHSVQRADQGRHRCRELSVLHHRAQRGHRRVARPAAGQAWPRSSSPNAWCRRSSSSSTSPAWWPARARAKAWATSSCRTSARPMPIVNVVRCFEDGNVIHVAGKVDPISDIEVIQTELCLADLAHGRKEPAAQHQAGQGAVATRRRSAWSTCSTRCHAALNEAKPVRALELQQGRAGRAQAAVPDHRQAGDVSWPTWPKTASRTTPARPPAANTPREQNAPVVAICAKTEAELADMDDADKQLFLAEMGQDEPGLNRLIRAAFKLLGLQTYFTAGVKEVRAWTIHVGDTGAAGGRRDPHRLRARLHPRPDHRLRRLHRLKGEQGAKEAGKMRSEGKEYVVQGWRRAELPVQRLNAGQTPSRSTQGPDHPDNSTPERTNAAHRNGCQWAYQCALHQINGEAYWV